MIVTCFLSYVFASTWTVNELFTMQRNNASAGITILNLLTIRVKIWDEEVHINILSVLSLPPLGWLIYINDLNVLEQAVRSSKLVTSKHGL